MAPEYWTFTLTRAIVGATTSGVFLVAYVIGNIKLMFWSCEIVFLSLLTAMEMVSPSKRLFAGIICHMFFSVGYMLTALWAYLISDWRTLQIALTVPGLVFFCYWW